MWRNRVVGPARAAAADRPRRCQHEPAPRDDPAAAINQVLSEVIDAILDVEAGLPQGP